MPEEMFKGTCAFIKQEKHVCFSEPVKVMDMNTYSTSHYHLMNEHVVDRAGTPEQVRVTIFRYFPNMMKIAPV